MSITNPIRERKKIIEVVVDTGIDPTPSTSLANALEFFEEAEVQYDQGTENSQSQVASATMSKRPTITGTLAGSLTLSGNLKSSDGTLSPAVEPCLISSGMSSSASVKLVFSDVTGLTELDAITGDTSGATGVVAVIDGTTVILKNVVGTFEAEDVDSATYTISSVSSFESKVYVPDSESVETVSVFLNTDGNRDALKKCASNFTLTEANGELPVFEFSFVGKTDTTNRAVATMPTATYQDVKPPVFKGSQMLLEWNDGADQSYVPINISAEFNFGATPELRANSVDDTGIVSAFISSRGEAGGTIVIEVDELTNFNPFVLKEADQDMYLSYRVGDGTEGRTIYIREHIQMSQAPSKSATGGLKTYTITYDRIGINLDDDEGYIVFA